MRLPSLVLAACMAAAPVAWSQQALRGTPETNRAASLTLAAALLRAEDVNPTLRVKLAERAAAEGASRDAHAPLAFNPQVQLEAARRDAPTVAGRENFRELAGGVSQTLETGGQPAFRRAWTDAALQALEQEIADLRLQQRAEVGRRFYRVLALQSRVEVETRAVSLFEEAARAVERRRAAGEDTRLDANLALVEAERARNQAAATREQLLEARAALAVPLQWPSGELPQVEGALDLLPAQYTEAQLLASIASHPRLQALASRQRSSEARVGLERAAARSPDVTLGVSSGREGPPGARERLTTFTVSVPIPLFRRNASGIGAALTESQQAAVVRQETERDLPTQVRSQWAQLQSLRERVERYQRAVLPALSRNEELSARSRQAGQIGILEQLVTQRQVLDARRDLLDAQLDYLTTQLTLEATAGWQVKP